MADDDSEPKVGVSWVQVAGSALAAVSSAVLLSTLGVAGTLVGAAVGSVVATLSTALYTRTLDVSRQQVAAQAAALRRVTRARSELDEAVSAMGRGEPATGTRITRAEAELDAAEEVLAHAPASDPDDVPPGGPRSPRASPLPSWRASIASRLSWRRLALLTAAVFLAAMATITAFELATGRAVSEYTGGSDGRTGTTVPGLGRGEGRETPRPSDDATPDTPTGEPEPEPDPSPSDSPTGDPTGDPTSPSGSPTADPTLDPTTAPTPSPSPGVTPALPSSTASGATGG